MRVRVLAVTVALVALVTIQCASAQDQAKGDSSREDAPDDVPRRVSGGGGVQPGGSTAPLPFNFYKGTKDGRYLPPWDPFGINRRHVARRRRYWGKIRAAAEVENIKERCRQKKELAARRAALEKAEQEVERREFEAEVRKAQKDAGAETDLMELQADIVDAHAEAEESEMQLDESPTEAVLSLAEVDIQAHVDALDSQREEAEADADAAEEVADLAEEEADLAAGDAEAAEDEALTDVDAEAEGAVVAADAGGESDSLLETEESVDRRKRRAKKTKLRPSPQVFYTGMPDFDNHDDRAVFHRREHEKTVIRFQRDSMSDGGQPVVKGLMPATCGRTQTDQGLFQAAVSEHLKNPVTAGDPFPPKRIDDNLRAIHHFPVVPTYASKDTHDEYGDPVE